MIKKILITVLVFGTINLLFAGGGRRNGTGGAQELLIPVGARGIALNGSYVAGITGLDAIYYNPAGLSGSTNTAEAAFSVMNYIADIDFVFAGVGINMQDFGSVGVTVRSLDFGDIPVTTVDRPAGTGAMFSPTFVTVGLTYSNFLTDRIRAGVSFNLVTETIENTTAQGLSIDAGIQYEGLALVDGLKLGLVLRNFGGAMSFEGPDLLRTAEESDAFRGPQYYSIDAEEFELPSQLELGLAYEKDFDESIGAEIMGVFQNNNFSNDEYKLGAEIRFKDMIFLRGGYSFVDAGDSDYKDEENLFGPTFGAGFKLSGDLDITFDYAFRTVEFFDNNQVFDIRIAF